MAKLFANSGDPDQTPRSAASDLGLHCLPITLLRVSRLQWVNALLLASCPTIWTVSFLSYNLNKFIWLPVDLSETARQIVNSVDPDQATFSAVFYVV